MSIYAMIFYVLAALILVTTALGISRRNLVHAVVYLIFSFFGSALLFYLLGAPLLAVLEVIIYAGAIMVLFLFIIMMMKARISTERIFPLSLWLPAALSGLVYLAAGLILIIAEPDSQVVLETAKAEPAVFGQYIFEKHWLSIEIVSLLLLIVLIGALVLGRRSQKDLVENTTEGDV